MSYLHRSIAGFICSIFLLSASVCFGVGFLEAKNKDQTGILLIGQNYDYEGARYSKLAGCINDTANLKRFFVDTKGYPEDNIKTLNDRYRMMRGEKIAEAIQRMAESTQDNAPNRKNTIIISYSGHGSQLADQNREEPDGKDECIVAGDGFIRDDELHDLLKTFHRDTRILILMDACHSGTMLDLQYRCRYKRGELGHVEVKQMEHFTDILARVVCISGCQDYQTSADVFLEDPAPHNYGWESQGAMTNAFIKGFRCVPMDYIRNLPLSLRDAMVKQKFRQRPVVTANIDLNNDAKEMTLFDW